MGANADTQEEGAGSPFGGGEFVQPRGQCIRADSGGNEIWDRPHDTSGSGTGVCRAPYFERRTPRRAGGVGTKCRGEEIRWSLEPRLTRQPRRTSEVGVGPSLRLTSLSNACSI